MFFGVQFYAYLWLLRQGMTLRRTLKKTGRTISLQNAKEKINAKQGILIADAPTLGWNVSRLWWSEDTNFLPRTFKTEEEKLFPPEDRINYDRFIAPSKGCAKLISGFIFTQKLKGYLKKNFDIEDVPYIFTGRVLFLRNIPLKDSLKMQPKE